MAIQKANDNSQEIVEIGLFSLYSSEVESRTQGSRPRPRTQKNFEAKAKDQGHRRKCSPKKKGLQKFFSGNLKKKGLQNFFSGEKGLQKIFIRRSLLEETKKKVFADFPQGFWRFPTKFQRFKNSAVLEPRTGKFSRTRGFEAKDFKMCPRGQGQGLQNVSSRPRTSSRTPPLLFTVRFRVDCGSTARKKPPHFTAFHFFLHFAWCSSKWFHQRSSM